MSKRVAPLIVGNWKTTPATREEAVKFVKALDRKLSLSKIKLPKRSYYLATPDIFIPYLLDTSKGGYIGSENISAGATGQSTGLVSPSQLISSGVSFALVGHSEVRARGETQEDRAKKVELALQNKLTTILCVGEKARDNKGTYLHELEEDLKATLAYVKRDLFDHLILAYEPVWAIGAKDPATPQECFEVVIALRRALATLSGIDYAKKVHIIYGGTVMKDNAKSYLEEGGVDGLLIGRASQDVAEFASIIMSCHTK